MAPSLKRIGYELADACRDESQLYELIAALSADNSYSPKHRCDIATWAVHRWWLTRESVNEVDGPEGVRVHEEASKADLEAEDRQSGEASHTRPLPLTAHSYIAERWARGINKAIHRRRSDKA